MGYGVHVTEVRFRLPAERKAAALAAIKALVGSCRETCHDADEAHFSWVTHDGILSAQTLGQELAVWGWRAREEALSPCPTCGALRPAGDIVSIDCAQEKLGDELLLFSTIAPFVEPGSYIECVGEDGDRWRWIFDGELCREVHPAVVWPESGKEASG